MLYSLFQGRNLLITFQPRICNMISSRGTQKPLSCSLAEMVHNPMTYDLSQKHFPDDSVNSAL